jgi:ribosomal protein L37AE/L43A
VAELIYRVVGCPACEKLQLTIAKKVFRCKYCGKTSQLAHMKVLFHSVFHEDALKFLYQAQVPG